MFEDIQEGIKEGDFSIAAIADFFEATSDLLKRECRDCNFHNQTSKISLVASVASSWARKVRLQTNKDYITLPDYIETDVMNTVKSLPRSPNMAGIIPVNFKRKLNYKQNCKAINFIVKKTIDEHKTLHL